LRSPSCPSCSELLPIHFFWSVGWHAQPCPHCGKGLRSKESRALVAGFFALVVSWIPGSLFHDQPLLAVIVTGTLLVMGIALLVLGVSGGLKVDHDTTSLNL
jgi:hypothetical protein